LPGPGPRNTRVGHAATVLGVEFANARPHREH